MTEIDYGLRAQRAAEDHLAACFQANEDEDDDGVDSPAWGLFCGCEVCVVREILATAWPIVIDSAIAELVDAGMPEAAERLAKCEWVGPNSIVRPDSPTTLPS